LDTEDLHVGKRDDTESLVDLESVNRGQLDLGVLESLGHGERRRGGELGWVLLSITPAENLANGLETVLLDGGLGGEDEGSSAVGERGGVGGSYGSVLGLEGRAQCLDLGFVELA
jgi:hypothetical protein